MRTQKWRTAAVDYRRCPKPEKLKHVRTDEQMATLAARMLRRFVKSPEGKAALDLLRSSGKTIRMQVVSYDKVYEFTCAGVVLCVFGFRSPHRNLLEPEHYENFMKDVQKYREEPSAPLYILGALRNELDKIALEVPA